MISDKLKVVFESGFNRIKKGVNSAIFSMLMLRIAIEKASMSNNKRKMMKKPMIRKRAYIKNLYNPHNNK